MKDRSAPDRPETMRAMLAALGFLNFITPVQAVSTPELTVSLSPGETRISRIGLYRVGWQSYGGPEHDMPVSWSGESAPGTGIAYEIKSNLLGRESLFMHSPWRVPPGKTWVDYQLALPKETPIRLSFGIAMRPDSVLPDKSDGVTFSCQITTEAGTRDLLKRHWAKGEWENHEFDLSGEAGKTVTLRLQVEPGPKNNSSWDFSHFGSPVIRIGNSATSDSIPAARRLMASRAWMATEKADMRKLSNQSAMGIVPSNLLPYRNELTAAGDDWIFVYQADDCRIEYRYRPKTGTLDDFSFRIDDQAPLLPASGGGILAGGALLNGKLVSTTRRGNELIAVWEYSRDGQSFHVEWTYRIIGKALGISARCDTPLIDSLSLGRELAPLRTPVNIPYLAGQAGFLEQQGVFCFRYFDWTRSNSSHCPQSGADYATKTDGSRNSLSETGYIALSPELAETLPNLPHPASPFLKELAPRVMLDVWGHHQGRYAGDTEILRELKDNGVDHLAIIQHVWQRHGYDVKLPDHLPANPQFGSEEDLRQYGDFAKQAGYLWSLHENYIDLYPDAPSYDPSARVLKPDGTPNPAWLNEGTGVQSFGLKCNRALGFAKQNSPEAHRRYGTNAAYLDVHSCVPPWHQLDHDATQPMAAIARQKVERDRELFQYERDTHGGPLFGEGNNHFYWAGLCDGVEAQVEGGEDHVPYLDFDLLKIHPQMVNHGMGYYERWFRSGRETRWGVNAGTTEQLDKYRAMELAYGHAGFIGNALSADARSIVREHHLMHPVQRLYGNAKPVEIRYLLDGRFVSGGIALLGGDTSRQRIRYESGLTLWINWNPQPWKLPDGNTTLPQWGFLAEGPDTRVSTSLIDGKTGDFARSPGLCYVDARTALDSPRQRNRRHIEPKLREFSHLGGNRIRVNYEWRVDEAPGGDFHAFVHGVNPDAPNPDHIAFQQDHGFPKPTTVWRAGDVIVDGPYDITLPDTHDWFDLTIGLYQNQRLHLSGPDHGKDRVALARLKVDRENGAITRIQREDVPQNALSTTEPEPDFKAHTNPPGTWIDFGPSPPTARCCCARTAITSRFPPTPANGSSRRAST